MLRHPAFGLAEIVWRWSFGLAACVLLAFSCAEYFDTLPVSRGDLVLLRSRQPTLILRAILDIFRGSSGRMLQTLILLAFCLTIAWMVVSSLARAASIKALLDHFRAMSAPVAPANQSWRITSLFGLNFFRAAGLLAAGVSCLAPFIAAGRSSADEATPGVAFLIFIGVTFLVYSAWSVVNWFLSLSALFVVADGEDTFGAMSRTIGFCRDNFGAVCSVGTWFGLAHLVVFTIASFLGLFAMSLLGMLTGTAALMGALCVTLLYFAVADFLYIGRLAAYAAILELPLIPIAVQPIPRSIHPPSEVSQRDSIDQTELILSDLPSPAGTG